MSDEVVILQGGSKSKISDEQASGRRTRPLNYEQLIDGLRGIFGHRCRATEVETTATIHGEKHRVEFRLEQHGLMSGDQLDRVRRLLGVEPSNILVRVDDNTLRISVVGVYGLEK